MSQIPPRALVLLGILTVVWGTNWSLFPLAMREISVWTFRAISLGGAGMLLLVIARLRGQSIAIPRSYWPIIAVSSFFFLFVWNIASAYSAILIPSGQSAILGFSMPLWSALISWVVLREPMPPRLLVALMLGASAIGLLVAPGLHAYAQAPLGFGAGLCAGLSWAIGTLVLKRHPTPVSAVVLTGWQLLITSVPITAIAFTLGDGHWFVPSWTSLVVITYITLVPMSVGNVCWFEIVGLLPANLAGLSSVMIPIVAMVTGAIAHGEPLGTWQLLAMGCSVSSLALVMLRPAAQQR